MNEAARKVFEEEPEFDLGDVMSHWNGKRYVPNDEKNKLHIEVALGRNLAFKAYEKAYEAQQKRVDELEKALGAIEDIILTGKSVGGAYKEKGVIHDIELILWGLKNE